MKSWKWIAGFLFLFGFIVVIFNFSNKPNVQTSEVQSSLELNKPTKKVIPNSSNQTNPKSTPPSISDLSITELSELSKQYIVQCKDALSEYLKGVNEDTQPKLKDIRQKWLGSTAFEQQFALVLVNSKASIYSASNSNQNHSVGAATLSGLVENHPNSGIANYFLVSNCIISKGCDDSVFLNAVERDPYNGALWKLIATRHAAQGDVVETLTAFRKQISAPNYNTYWGEVTHLFDQALLEIGIADFLQRQVLAIGLSAALALPAVNPIFDYCRQYSLTRADIAEACLEFGETQFRSGDNLLEQSLGLSLKKAVYEQLGNVEKVKKVETIQKTFQDSWGRLSMLTNLAWVDSNLNKYWWENILLYGETKALQLTYAEAVRLSSDPSYNPCPSGKIEPETISNQ